jgi:hypothetical protein
MEREECLTRDNCSELPWPNHLADAAPGAIGSEGGAKMPDEDVDAIAEFIRAKGITRCPTACVLPTQGLIAAADRIALAKYAVLRDRVRRERAAARWRSLTLKGLEEPC